MIVIIIVIIILIIIIITLLLLVLLLLFILHLKISKFKQTCLILVYTWEGQHYSSGLIFSMT